MSLVADVDHLDYINILLYKIVLNSLSFQGLLNTKRFTVCLAVGHTQFF